MNALRGFASRRDSFGAGFEYLLPKGASRRMLCYFEGRGERLLAIWVHEAYLLALKRTPGLRPVITTDDVDAALLTVISVMRRTRRPLLGHLTRTVTAMEYDALDSDNEAVIQHFDIEAARFISAWATEIELAAHYRVEDGEVTVTKDIVDGALRAAVNRLAVLRNQARVEEKPTSGPPWRRLARFMRAWAGAILATLGGIGGAWTLISDQLQGAGLYTALPITLAVCLLGVLIVVAGRRR